MRTVSPLSPFFGLVLAMLLTTSALADVVVIVSAKAPLKSLSANEVSDIFLSKSGNFPDGRIAVPIDLVDGNPVRTEFYLEATGKSPLLLKTYWTKLIFTGEGEPPREVGDNQKMKQLIARNPNYIGYVDKSAVDGSVRVVLILP